MRISLALVLLLLVSPAALADDAFDKAKDNWKELKDRPPLQTRVNGVRGLLATKDPRALAIVAKRYAKPREPKDHEKYLWAWMSANHFAKTEHMPLLRAWADKHKKDHDAWLWFNALRTAGKQEDPADVLSVVHDARENPFLRAAALEALTGQKNKAALPAVSKLLGDALPRKPLHRLVLIESCAAVLLAHKDAVAKPKFQAAGELLIAQMKDEKVSRRTKLTIARHLAGVFDSDKITLDPRYWQQLLRFEKVREREADNETRTGRPRFAGLEASGERIAYLIDLSPSMTAALKPKEIEDAKKAGEALPWEKIKTRFDLAREYLRISLQRLDKELQFVVIGFRRKAEPFKATPGLVKASKGAVKAVLAQIDDFDPSDRTAGRGAPQATNLHGALRLAYKAKNGGMVKVWEHVEGVTFERGVDTIFILSDGKPTFDDFIASDKALRDGVAANPETGQRQRRIKAGQMVNVMGPYRLVGMLLADLERMNLFRKVEIHCVGMGEADTAFMRRLANRGLGKVRALGAPEAAK